VIDMTTTSEAFTSFSHVNEFSQHENIDSM
jgi:hypothetical protein